MFVDNLLLLKNAAMAKAKMMAIILELFRDATCMEVNPQKSSIPLNWVNQLQRQMIEVFPPFMVQMFEDNLAYLGFKLKPNNYKYGDGYGS